MKRGWWCEYSHSRSRLAADDDRLLPRRCRPVARAAFKLVMGSRSKSDRLNSVLPVEGRWGRPTATAALLLSEERSDVRKRCQYSGESLGADAARAREEGRGRGRA